jgi:hypothetical protein
MITSFDKWVISVQLALVSHHSNGRRRSSMYRGIVYAIGLISHFILAPPVFSESVPQTNATATATVINGVAGNYGYLRVIE